MIIDACKFSVPAFYQLVKNLVFVKNCGIAFSYLPIGLNCNFDQLTSFSGQTVKARRSGSQ